MSGPCPFSCTNKTEFGYCKTTACLYAPTIRVTSTPLDENPVSEIVERKTAKWNYQVMTVPGGKGQTYAKWSCSRCRKKEKKRSPYCPNCGSKMDGGQDA